MKNKQTNKKKNYKTEKIIHETEKNCQAQFLKYIKHFLYRNRNIDII